MCIPCHSFFGASTFGLTSVETHHTNTKAAGIRGRVLERFERDPGGDPRRLLAAHGEPDRPRVPVKTCRRAGNRPASGTAPGGFRLESLGSAGGVAASGAFPHRRFFRRLGRAQAVAHPDSGPASLYLRLRNGDE